MSVLWTSHEAMAATGGTCGSEWTALGVSIDTRTLKKGDLFVALKDIRDGHEFVAQALEKGAVAALVCRVPAGVDPEKLLVVPDVLRGLEALANAARKRAGKVIAITGSVGKTGTKEMLRTALTGQGRVHASERSYNNHWGVPLTLARMPRNTDFAVIEIGMNHPGEIAPLSRLTRPDVALITNVAAVHMAAFSDISEIAQEKAAIFEGLQDNGVSIINSDLETRDILANRAGGKLLRFGGARDADYRLREVNLLSDSTKVKATLPGGEIDFIIGAAGKHLALNALAALAAVGAVGADVSRAATALAGWQAMAGRGGRLQLGALTLIDESYNANPASMAAALESVAASNGRKVAILGDMLELGAKEHAFHTEIAQKYSIASIDVIHCIGPRMKTLYDALPDDKRGEWAETAAAFVPKLGRVLKGVDVVMVKGSLGMHMRLIVDAIKELGDARTTQKTGDL
ncbi:MAG: UDP-N-acetylmuramoyl-tripeptide--D-alanyl-D-alanine ligase [Paracoccaceae bacterium]